MPVAADDTAANVAYSTADTTAVADDDSVVAAAIASNNVVVPAADDVDGGDVEVDNSAVAATAAGYVVTEDTTTAPASDTVAGTAANDLCRLACRDRCSPDPCRCFGIRVPYLALPDRLWISNKWPGLDYRQTLWVASIAPPPGQDHALVI